MDVLVKEGQDFVDVRVALKNIRMFSLPNELLLKESLLPVGLDAASDREDGPFGFPKAGTKYSSYGRLLLCPGRRWWLRFPKIKVEFLDMLIVVHTKSCLII